jgi:trimeric autotransporter adhesin
LEFASRKIPGFTHENTNSLISRIPLSLDHRTQNARRYSRPDGGYPGGNTAEGQSALFSLTTGGFNTAVGLFSLRSNTTNSFNTAIGAGALALNTANESTATGAGALFSNTTGFFNTANGAFALFSNTTGLDNTANGVNALQSTTTGHDNTAVGVSSLFNNPAGSSNIALGSLAGQSVTTASHVICIGDAGQDVSNSCYIGQIFGQTSSGGVPVIINANHKLGTTTSSKRFKEDIQPMDRTSEALFSLKPVSFRYKKEIDPAGRSQLGLIAEDVEKINPDLVVRDNEGKPYSVRDDQVNAMVLNEFLKEHKKVQELEFRLAQ